MLTAHMDVVPVPEGSWEEWTHNPFDAHFVGINSCISLLTLCNISDGDDVGGKGWNMGLGTRRVRL